MRAKEDYLMGINFSPAADFKISGNSISDYLHTKYAVISVGRVMTCVLGMVVRREREIRNFIKTPFYRVISAICTQRGHLKENGGQYRDRGILNRMICIKKTDLRKKKRQKN